MSQRDDGEVRIEVLREHFLDRGHGVLWDVVEAGLQPWLAIARGEAPLLLPRKQIDTERLLVHARVMVPTTVEVVLISASDPFVDESWIVQERDETRSFGMILFSSLSTSVLSLFMERRKGGGLFPATNAALLYEKCRWSNGLDGAMGAAFFSSLWFDQAEQELGLKDSRWDVVPPNTRKTFYSGTERSFLRVTLRGSLWFMLWRPMQAVMDGKGFEKVSERLALLEASLGTICIGWNVGLNDSRFLVLCA